MKCFDCNAKWIPAPLTGKCFSCDGVTPVADKTPVEIGGQFIALVAAAIKATKEKESATFLGLRARELAAQDFEDAKIQIGTVLASLIGLE